VFLPLREPGSKIWPEVIQEVEKGNKIKALRKTLETAAEDQKAGIQQQIDKLLEVPEEIEYPKKVDSENILHLIVVGPPKSGKTHIAQQISKLHKRALIKVD
jgi:SpoVK/Ycf46/Vps4 family AAA+-type ATPase